MVKHDLRYEAEIFGTYLLKLTPSEAAIELYGRALAASPATPLSRQDKRLLAFVVAHPRCLGMVDAGLCFVRPRSDLRRRLYLMFSILETRPEYHRQFLPQDRSWWYLFGIVFFAIRGVAKALVGVALIKTVSR